MRSFFKALSDMRELAGVPLVLIVGLIALVVSPFVETVAPGEITVCESRFGRGIEVWRNSGKEADMHWQGLCRVTTYHAHARVPFKEPLDVGEMRYTVRGDARFDMPSGDAELLAVHEAYGSEEGVVEKLVTPAVRQALDAAAADPDWAVPDGGWASQKLKAGLEYGLKRLSPTGAIWSPHEIKKKLQQDIRRRLAGALNPLGVPLDVELGFVTER